MWLGNVIGISSASKELGESSFPLATCGKSVCDGALEATLRLSQVASRTPRYTVTQSMLQSH